MFTDFKYLLSPFLSPPSPTIYISIVRPSFSARLPNITLLSFSNLLTTPVKGVFFIILEYSIDMALSTMATEEAHHLCIKQAGFLGSQPSEESTNIESAELVDL